MLEKPLSKLAELQEKHPILLILIILTVSSFFLYYATAEALESMAGHRSVEGGQAGGPYLCRASFLLFIAAFEGFLNLLYELYLRPDLKDSRILGRLSREQIDLKILMAPVYCTCFAQSGRLQDAPMIFYIPLPSSLVSFFQFQISRYEPSSLTSIVATSMD